MKDLFHSYSCPAIIFNGDGVDEHFVTTFANVLLRVWKPTSWSLSRLFHFFFHYVGKLGLPQTKLRHYFGKLVLLKKQLRHYFGKLGLLKKQLRRYFGELGLPKSNSVTTLGNSVCPKTTPSPLRGTRFAQNQLRHYFGKTTLLQL